jgi:hypothetical protein
MEGSTFYDVWHLHISPQPPKHKVYLANVKKEMIKSSIEPYVGKTKKRCCEEFQDMALEIVLCQLLNNTTHGRWFVIKQQKGMTILGGLCVW